jgi:hypothetical protein
MQGATKDPPKLGARNKGLWGLIGSKGRLEKVSRNEDGN